MPTNNSLPHRSAKPEHELIRQEASQICVDRTDLRQLLTRFAALVLQHLADFCCIDLVEDDGSIKRYVTMHVHGETGSKIEEHREKYPLGKTSAYGYPRVIKTGKSQFIPGVTQHLAFRLLSTPSSEETAPAVRSFICVPLLAHSRILGAVTVANTDRTSVFIADDLLLLEEIAEYLGECLDTML